MAPPPKHAQPPRNPSKDGAGLDRVFQFAMAQPQGAPVYRRPYHPLPFHPMPFPDHVTREKLDRILAVIQGSHQKALVT
jgi:hypothetical protein